MTNLAEARRAARRRGRNSRVSDRDRFTLEGGLDLVTPVQFLRPGFCAAGTENWEISIAGGYERIKGFTKWSAQAVPGSGPMTGVHINAGGDIYAARLQGTGRDALFRDDGGGNWVELTRLENFSLTFTADGVTDLVDRPLGGEPFEITGDTSGATADVIAALARDANGTVDGYIAVKNVSGTFQASEQISDGLGTVLGTLNGGGFNFTHDFLASSGFADRWEFAPYTGNVSFATYDAAQLAVIIDEDVAIFTPPGGTRVRHLTMWNQHLFLGTLQPNIGSSVAIVQRVRIVHSGLGRPLNFTAAAGANEYLLSDRIVRGFLPTKTALFIFTDREKHVVTGTSIDDFTVAPYDLSVGATEWSMQPVGFGIHYQTGGFETLIASDRFANFEALSISEQIDPLINTLGTVNASSFNREKGVYRCYFDDGTIISATVRSERVLGFMKCDYGKEVFVADTGNITGIGEVTLFGTNGDAYIYRADDGTNFDGAVIDAPLVLPHHFSGYPGMLKTWKRCEITSRIDSSATVNVTVKIRDEEGNILELPTLELSGATFPPFVIEETGVSISLHIDHNESAEASFAITGVLFQTTLRGVLDRRTEVG